MWVLMFEEIIHYSNLVLLASLRLDGKIIHPFILRILLDGSDPVMFEA